MHFSIFFSARFPAIFSSSFHGTHPRLGYYNHSHDPICICPEWLKVTTTLLLLPRNIPSGPSGFLAGLIQGENDFTQLCFFLWLFSEIRSMGTEFSILPRVAGNFFHFHRNNDTHQFNLRSMPKGRISLDYYIQDNSLELGFVLKVVFDNIICGCQKMKIRARMLQPFYLWLPLTIRFI